jgi:TPP-dependent pyruvate/acetoin dehydrogenase alpha subunit
MVSAPAAKADAVALLRSMQLIRSFEEALLRERDHGFQLLSSGEEAVAVGVCASLAPGDQLLVSGRSIGPALARGLDPRTVMAELLGKSAGPCRGKGGRGHLAQPSAGFLGAHAVVGGNIAIAAGAALAAEVEGRSTVVACVFGDGACGSGALHETLNIAALWKLPLVLICDNNQLSVSTPRSEALAPERLSDLAQPFGIPGRTVDGMDAIAVRDTALAFVERARSGEGPSFLECVSHRFASHSSLTRETRTAEEMRAIKQLCPIRRLADGLKSEGVLSDAGFAEVQREVEAIVEDAVRFASAAPYPDPSEALTDVV